MELPSSKTVLMAIAFVLALVIVITIVSIVCSEKPKPFRNKLVKFGGQFRQVSGLNLGHPLNAPIFHARPWFGKDFNSGLKEYIGALIIPEGQSLYVKFPPTNGSYEISVVLYPEFEVIGSTIYCPSVITVGYSVHDNIILPHLEKTILFLVTGIGIETDTSNTNSCYWLDRVDVYLAHPPSFKRALLNIPPTVNDYTASNAVEEFEKQFLGEWLRLNPDYTITKKVIALPIESFPVTLGLTNNIVYVPESPNETLIVIYPNRINTLNKEAALYAEVKGKRTYLKQENNIAAGAFIYNADTLDSIYVEEKILVDPNSRLLPVTMYVLNIG
jgi:hypothetical protein